MNMVVVIDRPLVDSSFSLAYRFGDNSSDRDRRMQRTYKQKESSMFVKGDQLARSAMTKCALLFAQGQV